MTKINEFMEGRKTYIGLIVAILGFIGIAQYFGGNSEMAVLVDKIVEVVGLLLAAYGRYKTK